MPENRCDDLKRRTRITAGARFNAAKRLALQEKLSQWSIAFASAALVIVPLLQAMDVTTGLSAKELNVLQVALAILVLVFALLLSHDNAAVRSDKMHRCALELNKLIRRIEREEPTISDDTYMALCNRYDNILSQYDNHETRDYEAFLLYRREEFYPGRPWLFGWRWFRSRFALMLDLSLYLLLLGIIGVAFVLMLRQPPTP